MIIDIHKSDDCTVLSLDGMLDTSSCDEFKSAVDGILSEPDDLSLTLDMTRLHYISSRGIRSVLTLIKKMKEMNRPLVFKGICPAVMEILDLSGLTAIMNIAD